MSAQQKTIWAGSVICHEKDEEKNDLITRELDNGIRAFQKDKDLRVDGILKPGGETERAVFQAVEGKRGDAYFRLAELARTPGINDKPARTDATGRIIRDRDAERKQTLDNPPVHSRKPDLKHIKTLEKELLDFIGFIESRDNYNIIYGGQKKPLTRMTVKEVMKLQEEMIKSNKTSSAVGRYQFLKNTLEDAVKDIKVNKNALFDEELQDKLAKSRLKYRKFENFNLGKISSEEFIENLAMEWAAIPKDTSNQSYWEGTGNNKALTKYDKIKNLLETKSF